MKKTAFSIFVLMILGFYMQKNPKREPVTFVKSKPTIRVALRELAQEKTISVNKKEEIEEFSLSLRSQEWAARMPQPQNREEKIFLDILAAVYDTPGTLNPSEVEEIGRAFLRASPHFDQYIVDILEKLEPGRDQHERNFIFGFIRHARPEISLSSLIVRDVHYAFGSGGTSGQDKDVLTNTLLSQSDMTFEEKTALMDYYKISQVEN